MVWVFDSHEIIYMKTHQEQQLQNLLKSTRLSKTLSNNATPPTPLSQLRFVDRVIGAHPTISHMIRVGSPYNRYPCRHVQLSCWSAKQKRPANASRAYPVELFEPIKPRRWDLTWQDLAWQCWTSMPMCCRKWEGLLMPKKINYMCDRV